MPVVERLLDTLVPRRLGREFRRLVAASWTLQVGDGIALAAGPLLVASQTHNAFLVALAPTLQQLPWLLFGLYAGALADRLDRRLILIVAGVARSLVLMVLVGFLATGNVNITVVLVVVFLLGVSETFLDATATTLTPMLVAKADLGTANARLHAGFITINQLIGPPVGAAVFAIGMVWPFVVQVVVGITALLIVVRLALPPHGVAREDRVPVRTEIVEGMKWLWRHDAVRTLALVIVSFNVTWGAAWSVLVLYATKHLGMPEIGFGLLTTFSAIGGLLSTMAYGLLERRVPLATLMKACLTLECLGHLAFALNRSQLLAYVIMFVFGAYAFVWGTLSGTVRQRAVPTEFQGRVASVYLVGVFGGVVVGNLIGGAIAQQWGLTAPFWFAFVGSTLTLLVIWRQLDLIAHADAEVLAQEPTAQ